MEKEGRKKYDLEDRTSKFGERIIDFVKTLPRNEITIRLIEQATDSGTSVGANYCEADCAESKKDFEHKIGICSKESKETKHWMRMIAKAVPQSAATARLLWKEAHELNLIFVAIIRNSKSRQTK